MADAAVAAAVLVLDALHAGAVELVRHPRGAEAPARVKQGITDVEFPRAVGVLEARHADALVTDWSGLLAGRVAGPGHIRDRGRVRGPCPRPRPCPGPCPGPCPRPRPEVASESASEVGPALPVSAGRPPVSGSDEDASHAQSDRSSTASRSALIVDPVPHFVQIRSIQKERRKSNRDDASPRPGVRASCWRSAPRSPTSGSRRGAGSAEDGYWQPSQGCEAGRQVPKLPLRIAVEVEGAEVPPAARMAADSFAYTVS